MLIQDIGLCYTAEGHANLPMQLINRRKLDHPKNFIQSLFHKSQAEVFFFLILCF